MSEQNPEGTEQTTPATGTDAPPSVEPVSPTPQAPEPTDVNPDTAAAVGEPDGNAVDASDDPNLGHAFEDQSHGVGVGPGQTTEEIEAGSSGDDVAGAI